MLIPKVIIPGILLQRRSSPVCCFNLWMHGGKSIFNLVLCLPSAGDSVGRAVDKKFMRKSFETKNEKHFPRWDYENFKLNGTRKTICWEFLWLFELNRWAFAFHPRTSWISSPDEITSLREYQCRKIGLNLPPIDFLDFRWKRCWNILCWFYFIGFVAKFAKFAFDEFLGILNLLSLS